MVVYRSALGLKHIRLVMVIAVEIELDSKVSEKYSLKKEDSQVEAKEVRTEIL
jgi:hypothetical protein